MEETSDHPTLEEAERSTTDTQAPPREYYINPVTAFYNAQMLYFDELSTGDPERAIDLIHGYIQGLVTNLPY